MSETLGSLIDKLTIANLRLWHLEEVKHDNEASDSEVTYSCTWDYCSEQTAEWLFVFVLQTSVLHPTVQDVS